MYYIVDYQVFINNEMLVFVPKFEEEPEWPGISVQFGQEYALILS